MKTNCTMKKNMLGLLIFLGLVLGSVTVYPLLFDHQTQSQTTFDSSVEFNLSIESGYVTFFGGTSTDEESKIAVDTLGNIVMAGQTRSTDLPTTPDVVQANFSGIRDGYVAKFNPAGDLVFCTYIGGNLSDLVEDLILDEEGNIIIVGATDSTDFPIVDGFQSEHGGDRDGFILKLASNGTTILYSSFIGGVEEDWIYSVSLDSTQRIVISGSMASSGFGTEGVVQSEKDGGKDSFVAKFSEDGQAIEFFTYYGGLSNDFSYAVDVDGMDNVVISGVTWSEDLVTHNAIQENHTTGGLDIFIVSFNHNASAFNFATYFGGNESERTVYLIIDSEDSIIITGDANSNNYPLRNPYQDAHAGGSLDVTATKFASNGSLIASTYIGGTGNEQGWGITLDDADNVYIVGRVTSSDFPTTPDAWQSSFGGGGSDGFIIKMSPELDTLLGSSYFGGSDVDYGESVAITDEGQIIVVCSTESTESTGLLTTASSYQEENAGALDVYLVADPLPEVSSPTTTTSTHSTTETSSTATTSTTTTTTTPSTSTIPEMDWDLMAIIIMSAIVVVGVVTVVFLLRYRK